MLRITTNGSGLYILYKPLKNLSFLYGGGRKQTRADRRRGCGDAWRGIISFLPTRLAFGHQQRDAGWLTGGLASPRNMETGYILARFQGRPRQLWMHRSGTYIKFTPAGAELCESHPGEHWEGESRLRFRRSHQRHLMKVILFAALTLAISAIQATSCPAEVDFAALSLSKDQGVRAVVSNVGTASCPVQVSFFGADGSLIGNATTVELKAGKSTSVSASKPEKLVRATLSSIDAVDPAQACALKASVETFDVQTGVTLVSIPGQPVDSHRECTKLNSSDAAGYSQEQRAASYAWPNHPIGTKRQNKCATEECRPQSVR